MENKNHWYDGWFYDKLIAPNQDKLYNTIDSCIENNSTVIDAGCGTGRLLFHLSGKCKNVTGVDLSERNIKSAKQNLEKSGLKNIEIIHNRIENLAEVYKAKFDYAVITFVIHEISPDERINVLKSLSKIANKIIAGDYITPQPKSFWSRLNYLIEFAAGKDHFNNFRHFINNGGILKIAKDAGLKTEKIINNFPMTSQIVILKP